MMKRVVKHAYFAFDDYVFDFQMSDSWFNSKFAYIRIEALKGMRFLCLIFWVMTQNCLVWGYHALCSVLLTKYHSVDQVKKTEMGRTCGTYGGEERCIQGFGGET
jgi:hypothetical protein